MLNYITLDEAAIFEGVGYEALKKRVQRNTDKYDIQMVSSDNGGKDRLMVSLDSLSSKAKRAYRQKVKIDKLDITSDAEERPWYVDVDYNWYKENNQKYFYESVELSKSIEEYLSYGKGKTDYGKILAKKLKLSNRSFHRKVNLYMEGSAWAARMKAETGKNYDFYRILALCRKPTAKGGFPSLAPELKVLIENIYYDKDLVRNNYTITNIYEDLEEKALDMNLQYPSYDTVWRYIKYIEEQDGVGVKTLGRNGTREWKNKCMSKRKRDTAALQVLEILQGDVHSFDFWVEVARPNGKKQAIRPCLVAWLDMKSRCLIGWAIAENPDSEIIKKSLVNAFYPKKNKELPYGVCKYLLIDNGKEYTAESLTGRKRTVRVNLDSDVKGFYRCLGIEDDMRSLPYQPWSKAQVERFFGTVCNKFSKRMKSYTGTLTASRTSSKIKKDITGMLDKGELITLEEASELFEKWVVEKYHTSKHKGLIEDGAETPVPINVFNESERYFKAAPPLDFALSMLTKSEERVVKQIGIKINKWGKTLYYNHPDLHEYLNKKVSIRYYPEDITKILVYNDEGIKVCEAISHELLQIGPKITEKGFIEHNKSQKRELRNDRERLKYRRMSYEERLEYEKSILENSGKKIVTPELSQKNDKVITLPSDKQYKEKVKEDREVKKSKVASNEYLDIQAEKALAKLRKLG